MYNIQQMNPIVISETAELNPKCTYLTKYWGTWPGQIRMTLLRNACDDTFNLETIFHTNKFTGQTYSINNKSFQGMSTGGDGVFKAHSSVLDFSEFKKAKSVGTYFKNENNTDFVSMALFPVIAPIDKNVSLDSKSYLKLRSINKIELQMNVGNSETVVDGLASGMFTKVFYTDTYVVPREFNSVTNNCSMFDIYVSNEDNEKITGDKSFLPGELSTSATGSSKIKLNTIPYFGTEKILDAKKVATVNIFDYSYYNYEKKKLEFGYGDDSQKGIVVPYNFKGNFRRVFKLSPNSVFKDMNIFLENKIDEPLLDPYEGKVVLHIDDVEDVADHEWRIISSENFERLKDINPSIEGLERISYEENL